MKRKILMIFMITIISFHSVFIMPQQQVSHAIAPIFLKEGAERLGKAVIKRFGYRMASTKQAREVGEVMMSGMSKKGADNFYDALRKAQRVDKTAGKWAKVLLPTALTAEIAGVLLTMTGDTGQDETIGVPSDIETEADEETQKNFTDVDDLRMENGKIVGIDFPLKLVPSALTDEFLGYRVESSYYPPSKEYGYKMETPFGSYAPSQMIENHDASEGSPDDFGAFNIFSIEIRESNLSGNYVYPIRVKYWNAYHSVSSYSTLNGSTHSFYKEVDLDIVVAWLREIGYSESQIVEVPQMPIDHNQTLITPENVPSEPLEIAIPTDYGYQEIFQNNDQIYQDTLNAQPNITESNYITKIYEEHNYPSDPEPIIDPETGETIQPEPDPTTVPEVDPVADQVPNSDPSSNPSTDPSENPTEDPSGTGNPKADDPFNPDNQEGLNLEPLKNVGKSFTERFPFSLPWDIKRAIDSLSGEKVEPKFKVALPTGKGLASYEFGLPETMKGYIPFVRGGFIAIFIIGLIYGTRQLMGGSV